MNWKTLLFCCAIAALFTSCFATDDALSGPSAEELENARRAGDLPLDSELASVTFINAESGDERTVGLTSQGFLFEQCGATWCPVFNPDAPGSQAVYCPPRPDIPVGDDPLEGALLFDYDETSSSVAFLNFAGALNMEAWAERGLYFTVEKENARSVKLSCLDCPGKYEDFQYTDRIVRLRVLE